MKRTPLVVLFSLSVLLFVGLVVRGYSPGTDGYLADLGLNVPTSAVVSHDNYPSLTDDEDLLIIQLTPSQIPSLLSQLKTKRGFGLAPIGTRAGTAVQNGLAPTKSFFAGVPKRARVGGFRVDHDKGEPHEWPTFCDFAVDQTTGRVWIYGWSPDN